MSKENNIRILSWDVGVTNLSYCLVEYSSKEYKISDDKNIISKDITMAELAKNSNIKHWGILDIGCNIEDCSQDNITFFNNIENEKKEQEKNGKEEEIKIKRKRELCKKYFLINTENIDNKKSKSKAKSKTKSKKKKYDINKISLLLFKKLDILVDDFKKDTNISPDMIDYILIENQPSLKNPKMKTIQILLYSYFMMRTKIDNNNDNIDNDINNDINNNINNDINNDIVNISPTILFISASGKLKFCKNEEIEKMFTHLKSKYTVRKKKAIEYCSLYMGYDELNIDFFNTSKKKDDLADSYLQAVQFMFKNKK